MSPSVYELSMTHAASCCHGRSSKNCNTCFVTLRFTLHPCLMVNYTDDIVRRINTAIRLCIEGIIVCIVDRSTRDMGGKKLIMALHSEKCKILYLSLEIKSPSI